MVTPKMTERDLVRSIVSVAKDCGWLAYHTFLSKWSKPGFPDLFMVRGAQAVAWECKSDKGKVSAAQQEWLDALALVPGIDARVVRPADLEDVYKFLLKGEPTTE